MPDFPLTRRTFVATVATAMGSVLTQPVNADPRSEPEPEICVFAKPLQWMSQDDLARQLAEWQVAGIEATLRVGGQIEPERLADDLPKLVDILAARNQRIVIAATDVVSVKQPLTETVLSTLAKSGIRYYRLGFQHYRTDEPILPQLDQFTREAHDLAQLNASLGLRGLLQNHAGADYFGAPLWDLARVLEQIDPNHLAVAFDTRHIAIESSQSWPIDYRLVRPSIGAIFCKDAKWEGNKIVDLPLGEGPIASQVFAQVRKDGIPGPISLHMEYIDHRDPQLLPQSIAAITRDLQTLRGWLA